MTAWMIRGGFGDAEPEGTLRARMDDGSEQDFTLGEVTLLPGGHDAWPDGGGGCAFVELSHGTVEHFG